MEFKYYIYVTLILSSSCNSIYADNSEIYRMTDKVFTCSKWLSSIIDNFCNNVYKIVKRDTSYISSSLMMDKLMPKGVRRSTNKRLVVEEHWRRVRRQVASECCERPCTVGNIIMYCPDDAKLLQENPDIFD